jgi:hypothetical protein
MDERPSRIGIAGIDAPANDQLRVGAQAGPRPHVTNAELTAHFLGNVLFLRIDERPDFVGLNPLAG